MPINSLNRVISGNASVERILIVPILTSITQVFLLWGVVRYISSLEEEGEVVPYLAGSIIVAAIAILTLGWVIWLIDKFKPDDGVVTESGAGAEIEAGDRLAEIEEVSNLLEVELAELKEENAELKILLEMVTAHGDAIAAQWQATLDEYYSYYELFGDDRWNRSQKLSEALNQLKATQNQLLESKKMAALGVLVAGIAHEINTPIGTALMTASFLANETNAFVAQWEQGQLKRSQLQEYLDNAKESSQLILSNLQRAGELVQSFKQVAVDQTKADKQSFVLKLYLEEALHNLAPHLKQTKHNLTVEGDDTLIIESYPGPLSQVVTNLVLNSIIHAYKPGAGGNLRFEVGRDASGAIIYYSDDGCGIPPQNLDKIFEPFFTTARAKGGSGLGLHIVYNLVTQKLQGNISCESEVGKGTRFTIELPL